MTRAFEPVIDEQQSVSQDTENRSAEQSKQQPIRCKRCSFAITYPDYAIAPDGQHEHLQCNSYGNMFIFRCFERAQGCYVTGEPTIEFSWFPGHSWQYALCQGCGRHLGWLFKLGSESKFFGLIANKIK